ncbi:hypothetical protein GLOIN_2v327476 [Rhizophagus clarus]|uniref:3CxxC-type domain-containing protein n=1 Tax=Rhizophagus clarus TaxID=94130 RepID=A0A8H3QBD4_9GLOM|nr:hypothetical protein GLOIN_2v327476 [Rhizophagus clarus]
MSKEASSSNDQDKTECETGNIIVSNCDNNIGASNWDSRVNGLESNTVVTQGGWDDTPVSNLEESNITVRNLRESNPKAITSGRNISIIIDWGESNTTGLEAFNYCKIMEVERQYIRNNEINYVWETNRWRIERRYRWKNTYEEKEQIIDIISLLANNENIYRVYGYWICHQWECKHRPRQCKSARECEDIYKRQIYRNGCKHNPQCQNEIKCREKYNIRQWQRDNICQREWRKQYDQELFKKYLEVASKRSQENSNGKPDMEIICHLVWKDKYRVFGNWRCSNCQKRWRSAYTWISLQKYIEKTPGNRLNGDYSEQKCMEEECGSNGIIVSYESLVKSEDGTEHKRHLCAKCQSGQYCSESGTYFGNRK